MISGAGAVAPASPVPDPRPTGAAKLVIKIAASGDITAAGKALEDADVDSLLAAAVKRDANVAVVIVADKTLAHGRVVAILDRAKRAGVTRLGIGFPDDQNTAPTVTADPKHPTLVISIPATGDVLVGAKQVPDAELDKYLAGIVAKNKDVRVAVEADQAVTYARVWGILDRAKKAGIKMIGVVDPAAPKVAPPVKPGATTPKAPMPTKSATP
jgi:biopolymer transport protein ExbD